VGLGFGFAICILIYLFIQHELSHNAYPENSELKYRVNYRFIEANGNISHSAFVPDDLPEIFRNDTPEMEKIAAYRDTRAMIRYENQKYQFVR
jgi:putative ABC transport system permease protein